MLAAGLARTETFRIVVWRTRRFARLQLDGRLCLVRLARSIARRLRVCKNGVGASKAGNARRGEHQAARSGGQNKLGDLLGGHRESPCHLLMVVRDDDRLARAVLPAVSTGLCLR
jgi:hypothetical protein